MTPDELNNEQTNDNVDYINAINELKQNTVSRDQYDKLRAENKQLLDTLVSGGQMAPAITEIVDKDALRKELNDPNITNLHYCETALKLRQAVLDDGGSDIFLPVGKSVNVTTEDYASAEKVAQSLQECIEYANGDPQVFTMELQRRLNDVRGLR